MGYWFIAPGAVTSAGHNSFSVHMGGGGEFAIWKGISAGIEGGAVGLAHNYTNSVQGVASANGYYHFRPRDARLDPFATVGYSLFFRHGASSLVNFGGGLNYWIWRTAAVRVEVRDHVYSGPTTIHFWGIRLGMSFTDMSP
jgi:hypothetical protein